MGVVVGLWGVGIIVRATATVAVTVAVLVHYRRCTRPVRLAPLRVCACCWQTRKEVGVSKECRGRDRGRVWVWGRVRAG
jgi:hypothetical protein